ncbi:cell division cycle-associated 7-like protein isoform X2 [Boleophthalmus pectinirostris]|uniref:cell division cycle-associated 7-like protein isoform X2 n=1 Tax=Boleophthalmus pectinirostris TaxID=150288 RepID=UPI00243168CE|nr:cell division cycle-associated 7-like protein isoform X2 [Boleophthalmus pectinirostris]
MTLASKTPPNFRSQFITPELTHLFSQSDSEEEFEGFSEDEDTSSENNVVNMVESEEEDSDTNFYSDGEEPSSLKNKSLLVALRFPFKRPCTSKQQAFKKEGQNGLEHSPPRQKQKVQEQKKEDGDTDEEVLSQSLKKRNKNIQENKAMLAKLFADLSSLAVLTPPSTPQKKKSTPEKEKPKKRKFEADTGSERRNPSRKARPPEKFAVEEKPEPGVRKVPRTVDIRALVEVDEERATEGAKRRKSSKRSQYYVRSVDEITEEELDNIAYRSKDKIWDKENGSSCHQCRQKTLDTKSVCRSGFCSGVKGQFCGPCLKNRYGEDVRTALLDPTWSCPICRGMCNCSLCRKKEGRCATGILVQLARFNGHGSVHEYLESIKNELK